MRGDNERDRNRECIFVREETRGELGRQARDGRLRCGMCVAEAKVAAILDDDWLERRMKRGTLSTGGACSGRRV